MSGALDVNIFQMNFVAAFSGATEVPLSHVPVSGGGITVLDAWLVGPSAGTAVTGQLVTFGTIATGGTVALNGTIGAFAGTVITGAGIGHQLVISDSWVAGNEWIGWDQASGTVPAGSYITLAYCMGRGSPT
jgi:hypothetical protein